MTSAIVTTSQALDRLDENAAAVYLARLRSPLSRSTMQAALNDIARLLGAPTVEIDDPASKRRKKQDVTCLAVRWQDLRYQHTAALLARLQEAYSPATVNKMLSALRGVLKEAQRLGLMSADDYQNAAAVRNLKDDTLPAGREITGGELMALVDACKRDRTAAGSRDAAIIGVLYTVALRRAELVALDFADYDRDSGKLTVRKGKGGKPRTVYLADRAKAALDVWLIERGLEPGALFTPVRKNGKVAPGRMTAQAVYKLLNKRGKQAGVAPFSPHDFRRTFVGDMLERGVDIATVASIAGHASVDTTKRYDRRGEQAKQRAASKLHFPF